MHKSIKKKVAKAAHFIFDLAVILFIVGFAYIFIVTYRGNVPNIFGYHILRVVSSSMEPDIYEGECIISKEVNPEDIQVGDVISFFSEDPGIYGFLNTHRVQKVIYTEDGKREFITKGDNNENPDYFNAKEDKIVGRYIGKVLVGKIITRGFELLANKSVYFVLIILPIVLSLIESINSLIKIITGTDEDIDLVSADNDKKDKGEQDIA